MPLHEEGYSRRTGLLKFILSAYLGAFWKFRGNISNTNLVNLDDGIYYCDTTNSSMPTSDEGIYVMVFPKGNHYVHEKIFLAVGAIYADYFYWGKDYQGYTIQWAKIKGTVL